MRRDTIDIYVSSNKNEETILNAPVLVDYEVMRIDINKKTALVFKVPQLEDIIEKYRKTKPKN